MARLAWWDWPGMGMSLINLIWIFGLGGVLFLFGSANGNYLPLVVYALAAVVSYAVSLRIHPSRNCWTCKGAGKHWGWFWKYSSRACRSCGGAGKVQRLGVRLFLKGRPLR